MRGTHGKYYRWCKKIAESRSTDELITHFRTHVCNHFDRHNRAGAVSRKIWLIGVLNFMHIFEKKFPDITVEDMLFKLCTYHKNHKGGTDADFDVEEFLKNYTGEIKKFHRVQCLYLHFTGASRRNLLAFFISDNLLPKAKFDKISAKIGALSSVVERLVYTE